MNLLLSEPLPMRSTRALGDYSDDAILPVVIGDLSAAPFPLIRLTATRYFAADHPMQVTKVYTAKQQTYSWAQKLESDTAGNTWTIVEFAAPIPQGTEVAACGLGKLDSRTGALIQNPADAIACAMDIAGRDDDWSGLRAECSALNLTVAGRIATRQSIKAQVDQIAQSVGAIWSGGGLSMARLYPSAATPSPVLDLDRSEVSDITVTASLQDTADVLRVAYDKSDASGRSLHYIELTASPQRYGGLSKEVEYPWLRTPANAEAVGRPVLQRLAGERYEVAFLCGNASVRPGQWVRLVDNREWPLPGSDPVIMVLTAEVEPNVNAVRVTGETTVGTSTVTITAHSLALPDTVSAAIDVSVRDGIATFTVTDTDGRPIAGARMALDGGAPKTTDAQGKVTFPAVAGVHELAVEAPGMTPFSLQVTL